MDAFNSNYKATPAIVLQKLSVTSKYNFIDYFQQQIKIFKTFISQPASPTLHELEKA